MAYGDEHDNSYIGEIVRFVRDHHGMKDVEKQVVINRLVARPTKDELDAAYKQVSESAGASRRGGNALGSEGNPVAVQEREC